MVWQGQFSFNAPIMDCHWPLKQKAQQSACSASTPFIRRTGESKMKSLSRHWPTSAFTQNIRRRPQMCCTSPFDCCSNGKRKSKRVGIRIDADSVANRRSFVGRLCFSPASSLLLSTKVKQLQHSSAQNPKNYRKSITLLLCCPGRFQFGC